MPFPKAEISGGIKTAYRQAELLVELGFDCFIYQPDGHPTWFESRARLIPRWPEPRPGRCRRSFQDRSTVLSPNWPCSPTQAKKVLFVQAHTYALLQDGAA